MQAPAANPPGLACFIGVDLIVVMVEREEQHLSPLKPFSIKVPAQ
jgi:hypothetical protein